MSGVVERKELDRAKLKDLKIVVVMGGPGSGKGTQCERIAAKFGYTHLSSGDLLRAEVMSGSKTGQQLYMLMANGNTVPSETVNDLLGEAMLAKADSKVYEPVAAAGSASSASQQDSCTVDATGTASSLQGFLIDGFPINAAQADAFEADLGKPAMVIAFEANDEVLKGRLKSRANFDDTEDSIMKRLANYNEQTKPVIAKYGAKIINAERTADEIFADVEKLF